MKNKFKNIALICGVGLMAFAASCSDLDDEIKSSSYDQLPWRPGYKTKRMYASVGPKYWESILMSLNSSPMTVYSLKALLYPLTMRLPTTHTPLQDWMAKLNIRLVSRPLEKRYPNLNGQEFSSKPMQSKFLKLLRTTISLLAPLL